MPEANKRQVGGDHYKMPGAPEHWDIVAQHQLDYFQGQITKYVMRCRKKGGKLDVEKARHFLDKYLEVYDTLYPPAPKVSLGNVGTLVVGAPIYGDATQNYVNQDR